MCCLGVHSGVRHAEAHYRIKITVQSYSRVADTFSILLDCDMSCNIQQVVTFMYVYKHLCKSAESKVANDNSRGQI